MLLGLLPSYCASDALPNYPSHTEAVNTVTWVPVGYLPEHLRHVRGEYYSVDPEPDGRIKRGSSQDSVIKRNTH